MVSYKPRVVVGFAHCLIHIRHFAPKDDYHKERMDILAKKPVVFRLVQGCWSFLQVKTIDFDKTYLTSLQFIGLLIQGKQTAHSLQDTLK